MYGLDGLFSLKMPDPETESGEPVNTYCTLLLKSVMVYDGNLSQVEMLSWEFLSPC